MRCSFDPIDATWVPATSERLESVYSKLEQWEKNPNMQFKSHLRSGLFLWLAIFIPGLAFVADILLNGASYNFLESPPYFGPNSFAHLEGDRLATVKDDALK